MIVPIYCPECDEVIRTVLPDGTKYAQRTANKTHADSVHNGDMSIYKISLDKPMTSGELKHLQEFCDAQIQA